MATPATASYAPEDLELDLRWWAAANYLTVGQIYLRDNALLTEPLTLDHVKPRLLGHWGTSPGLSAVYALLNRLIRETGTDCLYITGPGHGGPALVGAAWLEGTYSEVYPHVGDDADDRVLEGAGRRRGGGAHDRFPLVASCPARASARTRGKAAFLAWSHFT